MIFFEKASQAYQFADGRPLARQASPRVRRSRSKFRSLNDRTKRRLPASRLPIRPRSGVSDCRAVALPLEWTKGPQGRIPPASSPGKARFQRSSVIAEVSRACASSRRRVNARRQPLGCSENPHPRVLNSLCRLSPQYRTRGTGGLEFRKSSISGPTASPTRSPV